MICTRDDTLDGAYPVWVQAKRDGEERATDGMWMYQPLEGRYVEVFLTEWHEHVPSKYIPVIPHEIFL